MEQNKSATELFIDWYGKHKDELMLLTAYKPNMPQNAYVLVESPDKMYCSCSFTLLPKENDRAKFNAVCISDILHTSAFYQGIVQAAAGLSLYIYNGNAICDRAILLAKTPSSRNETRADTNIKAANFVIGEWEKNIENVKNQMTEDEFAEMSDTIATFKAMIDDRGAIDVTKVIDNRKAEYYPQIDAYFDKELRGTSLIDDWNQFKGALFETISAKSAFETISASSTFVDDIGQNKQKSNDYDYDRMS